MTLEICILYLTYLRFKDKTTTKPTTENESKASEKLSTFLHLMQRMIPYRLLN